MTTFTTSTTCSTAAVPAGFGMPISGHGFAGASAAVIANQAQPQWHVAARLRGADAKHTPGDPPRKVTSV